MTIGDAVGVAGVDDITLGVGNLLLNVTGTVNQTSGNLISANGLALMVTGATTLTEHNDVNILTVNNTGTLQFTDSDGFSIGTFDPSSE